MNLPFRLGTTSYVYPAGWLANVEHLAGRVRDVELLLFEANGFGVLPDAREVAELRAWKTRADLSYTVHTPLDVALASADETRRRASVAAVLRAIDSACALEPAAWIVHMHLGEHEGAAPPDDLDGWRRRAVRSLEAVLATGVEPAALCLESLDFDYALLEPVLDRLGLSAAIDVGHLVRDGRPIDPLLLRNLHRTRVVQWHGVEPGGRDHSSLRHFPREPGLELLGLLTRGGYRGALTLEVFGEREFEESLQVFAALAAEVGLS